MKKPNFKIVGCINGWQFYDSEGYYIGEVQYSGQKFYTKEEKGMSWGCRIFLSIHPELAKNTFENE